jgi:tRNA-dihydrouridine synthase B
MKILKIGNISLKTPLILSPMVDVTDLPYRLLCRKAGASMAYTEMINIPAILNKNLKTLRMLKTSKTDFPVGLQITGNSISHFQKIAKHSAIQKFDLIDINCGCPSIRITGNESGSYLLQHPEKIGEMIRVLKTTNKIVTAKIRLGFKKNNVLKVSKEIEKAGADALTVHARLAHQGGGIPADHGWIKKVKHNIGIPVIGNGDVFTGKDAEKLLEICDGVMIARAAIGNPSVFKEISHYLKTGKTPMTAPKEKLKTFQEYLQLAKKHKVVEMPRIKFLGGHFIKGFESAAHAREKFMKLKDIDSIENFLKTIRNP